VKEQARDPKSREINNFTLSMQANQSLDKRSRNYNFPICQLYLKKAFAVISPLDA